MSVALALPLDSVPSGAFVSGSRRVSAWPSPVARFTRGSCADCFIFCRHLRQDVPWPTTMTGTRSSTRRCARSPPATSSAFERLVDREAPRLLRFAQGMLGSLDEAEDVVQDTLIRLWENADRWTPDARIGTWLHRVCYNRAIDRLRRRRAFVDDSVLELVPDESEPLDAALVRNEMALSVRDAIERLPPRQRTAVLLFHIQELAQRDAAEVMSVSEAAFESMLSRARRQLRLWLYAEDEHD